VRVASSIMLCSRALSQRSNACAGMAIAGESWALVTQWSCFVCLHCARADCSLLGFIWLCQEEGEPFFEPSFPPPGHPGPQDGRPVACAAAAAAGAAAAAAAAARRLRAQAVHAPASAASATAAARRLGIPREAVSRRGSVKRRLCNCTSSASAGPTAAAAASPPGSPPPTPGC
jgi:hypothetical protein